MPLFPCPFCGERDEREFLLLGEMGKLRPDTTSQISAEAWAAYLVNKHNIKGRTHEVWMHLTCSEVFAMARDSTTLEVYQSTPLRKEAK